MKFLRTKESIPLFQKPKFGSILSPLVWAENIHYSWFEDLIKGSERGIFAPFFGEKERAKFKTKEAAKRASFLMPFLASLLKNRLMPENILPIEQLYPSSLNPLLELSKEKRGKLIDLLGLIDLAIELRHIVEKKKLSEITTLLTKEEKALIDYFSRQPVKWVPSRLALEDWDGGRDSLFHLLHHRGLIRLGKALADEEESLIWHVVHRFDIGRGQIILKWVKSESEKTLIAYFKTEVINLMKRFQT